MKYRLGKIDKDVLSVILNLFSEEVLTEPLKNKSKHFQTILKGYRINKVPMHKLIAVYYDDFKYANSVLCEFLEKKVEELFNSVGISECLKDNTNEIDLFFRLKEITLQEKLNIEVHTILDIANIKYDKNTCSILENGSKNVFDLVLQNDILTFDKERKALNDKIEKLDAHATELKKERDEAKEELKNKKKVNENQEKIIKQLSDTLKEVEKNLSQVSREKRQQQDNYDDLVQKYEKDSVTWKNIKKEYDDLLIVNQQATAEVLKLEQVIDVLKEKQLSAGIINDSIKEVIEKLQNESVNDSELMNYIKAHFTKEDTLISALERLNKKKLDNMADICLKMDENSIEEKDLTIIRELENEVCVEFIILKNVYSLCARYVEQMSQKKDIYDIIIERV